MKVEEGKKLVRDAIAAGIFNDLGSGSNIDLCIITKNSQSVISAQLLRPYEEANLKGERFAFFNHFLLIEYLVNQIKLKLKLFILIKGKENIYSEGAQQKF